MRRKTKKLIIVAVIAVIAITLLMLSGNDNFKTQVLDSGIHDTFAQCVADSGANMYGADWCPACKSQKDIFGSSQSKLPYTECSLPNSNQQTIICQKAGIATYPTWKFADGSVEVGILSLEQLAEKTNCVLPVENITEENSENENSDISQDISEIEDAQNSDISTSTKIDTKTFEIVDSTNNETL